jgi:hypothetical protein
MGGEILLLKQFNMNIVPEMVSSVRMNSGNASHIIRETMPCKTNNGKI